MRWPMHCKSALRKSVLASLLLAGAAASELALSPLVKDMFGAKAAAGAAPLGKAQACYIRVYDKPHLATHPQQNVRDMALLVTYQSDAEAGAVFNTRIGVHFRKLGSAFETGGGCGLAEGGKAINCSLDCDGGKIGVELRAAQTVYVRMPDGAPLWVPGDDAAETPKGARFGSDDRIFKLTRSNMRLCQSVLGKQ